MIDKIDINITEEQIAQLLAAYMEDRVQCWCKNVNERVIDCVTCRGLGTIRPATQMNVSIIAAIGRNRGLGKDNDLLWKIPEDLKWFKQKTLNKTVVMGRKTFESIGRLLPKRENIVITSGNIDSVTTFNGLDKFLQSRVRNTEEIFIIGGGQIYESAMKYANRLYITKIHASKPSDVFFPRIGKEWDLCEKEKHKGKPSFTFCTYRRIR